MTLALRPSHQDTVSNRRRPARPPDITDRVKALTRLLSVVMAGLVVWIVILGVSLPTADSIPQWRLLWIGFDTVELTALAVTVWAIYRWRPLAVPAALITGTLFACDAWFDVLLSLGTRWWWFSLATAVVFELPLAAVLWGSARTMVHAVIAHQNPHTSQPPYLPRRLTTDRVRAASELGSQHGDLGILLGRPEAVLDQPADVTQASQ